MTPKKALFVAVTLFSACLNSCQDAFILIPPDTTPGRRDYTWTIDTLAYTYTVFYRLWAGSPTDVWVTGGGGYWGDQILHYDGTKWNTGIAEQYKEYYSPGGIYGFAGNDIYLGTLNGGIWYYDGISFKQIAVPTKDGHRDIAFNNLWGASSYDVYAFGAYPDEIGYFNHTVITHFYKGNWDMLDTDGLYGVVGHLYSNWFDRRIYLQVIGGRNYNDSTTIYEYVEGKYNKLYSNVWVQGLQADISLIQHEVYFIIGDSILTRRNGQFQNVTIVNNPNFYQRVWGRTSKDIFLMMVDGLAHYDGTDVQYLFHYGLHTQVAGAALFDKDVVFLIVDQTGLNLIYHGHLKYQ